MQQSYEHIRLHFGEEATKSLKLYSKTSRKLANLQQSRIFLLKCRTYGLIPKFIRDSTSQIMKLFDNCSGTKKSARNLTNNLHVKLINLIISQNCTKNKYQHDQLRNLHQHILNILPNHVTGPFFESQHSAFTRFKSILEERHTKKFNALKQRAIEDLGLTTNKTWFDNRTSIRFPDDAQLMLSLGKKFSLPYDHRDLPLFQMIADSEHCLQFISDENERGAARAKLCNLIGQFANKNNSSEHRLILKLFDDTIKFLANYKNEIIITTSDKGGVTVVMWRREYLDKLNTLISDRNTYWPLRSDPTHKLQTKNNDFIKSLHKAKIITDFEKYKMTTYKALPPKLYGLPKTHKENCPIRPIVSSVDSPVYQLSRFLASILKNLTSNSTFNVKNSIVFKEIIKDFNIPDNDIMVSFDVISLFTNIPTNLCLKTIENNWDRINPHTNIPKKLFMEMLKFCIIEGNYFVSRDKFYKQSFGIPMGSPLSPILADIIMEDLLNVSLKKMKHKPKIILKYVDDLFSILSREHLPATLSILNDFHPKLQFTVEEEKDGSLSYLDVKIIRQNKKLILDWYQKPTSSGRLLHYKSTHPKHQILNTAKNFIDRVLNISNTKFHKANITKIRSILRDNGFPDNVIKRLFFRHNSNKHPPIKPTNNFKSTIYVSKFSEKFSKIINPQKNKIGLALKTDKNVNLCFTKLKDKVPKQYRSNVIYQISCKGKENETCNLNYVGTTGQFLKNRIAGHRSDLKCSNNNKTALSSHCKLSNHVPDFENAKILKTVNNHGKRLIIESLYIQCTKNTMNKKTETENVDSMYFPLLERFSGV